MDLREVVAAMKQPSSGIDIDFESGVSERRLSKWLVESGTVDHRDDAGPLIGQLVAEKYLAYALKEESEKSRGLLWGEAANNWDKDNAEKTEKKKKKKAKSKRRKGSSSSQSVESSLDSSIASSVGSKQSEDTDKEFTKASKKSNKNFEALNDELTTPAIVAKLNDIIAELTELVPAVRKQLNSSAFADLMFGFLAELRARHSASSADDHKKKETPSATHKKLSSMNRGIDQTVQAWQTELEFLKSTPNLNAIDLLKKMRSALKGATKEENLDLCDGESVEWTVQKVSLTGLSGTFVTRLVMTSFRLLHVNADSTVLASISLASILSVSKIASAKSGVAETDQPGGQKSIRKMEIVLKNQQLIAMFFKSDAIHELEKRFAKYKAAMPLNLYCWKYRIDSKQSGWNVYDVKKEWARLGVPGKHWRLTEINKDYTFADTYPSVLAVPASATDELLQAVGPYRSRARIPVLAYRYPMNGATLTRCSQPAVGMRRNRSKDDEKLLADICATNELSQELPIMDARPRANAVANFAMGYGFEIVSHYANCSLTFCDIENIHVMRNSVAKVRELLYAADDSKFLAGVVESGWLRHQYQILSSAVKIVDLVHTHNTSVLVHCTDGWDRTSQLISLAALMLDPYYRTIEGFIVMVEKDWLSFGHRFALRHAVDGSSSSDRAPIFQQFIECVWQLQQLYPRAFEFNELFLITLIDEVYALRFGTFMYDSEKERVETNIVNSTQSLWSYVLDNAPAFKNPCFATDLGDVIIPVGIGKRVRFWESLYMRTSTSGTALATSPPPCSLWQLISPLSPVSKALSVGGKKKKKDAVDVVKESPLRRSSGDTNTTSKRKGLSKESTVSTSTQGSVVDDGKVRRRSHTTADHVIRSPTPPL